LTQFSKVTHNPVPMAAPLVRWCLQTGTDYRELTELLKPLYLEAGRARLIESGVKVTDSALSLLTGLHRKDIRQAREQALAQGLQAQAEQEHTRQTVSVPAQLVARWLAQDLPRRLPWQGAAPSFQALAQAVSKDVHPKALLNTLQLQGVVNVDPDDATVQLLHDSYTPAGQSQAMLSLLSESVADHLQAGLNNFSLPPERRHLEQSVFADGLSAESVDQLERLATQLWYATQKTLLRQATTLCEQDEAQGGQWRFRVGMYSYGTDTSSPTLLSTPNSASPRGANDKPVTPSNT
jgi:hypothetical protein